MQRDPATMRRVMIIILFSVKWQLALVYRKDTVIFFKAPQENIAHTNMVLILLKEASVALSLKNFAFFTNPIDYLGHLIKLGRPKVDNNTTDGTRGLKEPMTVIELRSFLGPCKVIRQFVFNFSIIASSVSKQLKKTQAKDFGPLNKKERNELNVLKEKLISPRILTLLERKGQFTLHTDACDG